MKLDTRRDMSATAAIIGSAVILVLVLGRTWGQLAPGECQPMLDRYVELRLHASYEKVPASLLEDMEEKTRRGDRATEALGDCTRHLTRETADCAMKAPSADELERCFP